MAKIFFDLDGTLIHAQDRLYRLFQELAPAGALSFDEYWGLKRRQVGHAAILQERFGWAEAQIADFERAWLDLIEDPEWLALDHPFNGVDELLKILHGKHELYVVTARQHEDRAVRQIAGFGWRGLITRIFVTGRTMEKYDLIHGVLSTGPDDWYIGDTGMDIRTGKRLHATTVAVLSGFRDKAALERYEPDHIIDDVTALPALIGPAS